MTNHTKLFALFFKFTHREHALKRLANVQEGITTFPPPPKFPTCLTNCPHMIT